MHEPISRPDVTQTLARGISASDRLARFILSSVVCVDACLQGCTYPSGRKGSGPLEPKHRRFRMQSMKPKTLYLVLCVAGIVVPYWQFVPWFLQHGLNLPLFVRELFSTRIGAFFGMDVVMSAVTLLVFSRIEGMRVGVRGRWLVALSILTVGVSLGLPLFLYLREQRLNS